MTTTAHPQKRALLVHCDHIYNEECERCRGALDQVLARWDASAPGSPVEQFVRERVVLAEIRTPRVRVTPQRPLVIVDDDERHGDSLLGAAGAWACVAISVLLIVAIAIHQLWLWW